MAVEPVISQTVRDGPSVLLTWALTPTDQVAKPYLGSHRPWKCVQLYGDFNGATIAIQGTNDPAGLTSSTNYAALTDEDGNFPTGISFTAAGALITRLVSIRENSAYIKPVVTAGLVGASGVVVALVAASPGSRAG